MSTREVPVSDFGKNLFSDPDQFMDDFVDALDAKIKLNDVVENLTDMMKGLLKSEGADMLKEHVVGPMQAKTITCED